MTSLCRFAVPMSVSVLVAMAAACRDGANGGAIAPVPTTQRTARLVVEPPLPADSVITVALRVSQPTAPRIGSMTAGVVYDSTVLRFVGDVPPADGALRAAHASRGRVMIAVAHAAGFENDVLTRIRFVARDAQAYRSLGLQVTELHLLDASDVKATLSILPVEVVR
jgi:hypothetical protein